MKGAGTTSLRNLLIHTFGKRLLVKVRRLIFSPWKIWSSLVSNRVNIYRNRSKHERFLEIGSGNKRIDGFETLDIYPGRNVDYVLDASKKLPFRDKAFDLVYASHVLEHIPWYLTEQVLEEWVRILKPGASLEIWVPDGLKICRTLMDAESTNEDNTYLDGWYKFNPDRDPCIWAASRFFSYGDGTGVPSSENWHRAVFTPVYLKRLFSCIGLMNVQELSRENVRGYDHGWINLGMKGVKK